MKWTSIILFLLLSTAMAEDKSKEDDLWGAIDMAKWKQTPFISGRYATEKDVKEGQAVFCIGKAGQAGVKPMEIKLPACAIHVDGETKTETLVIIIQAEEIKGQKLIGYRFLNGGNGMGLWAEFQILEGPDERFTKKR